MLWLPNLVLAVVSVIVGFTILILPETAGKPLPQTVEDVEKLYLNIKYFEDAKNDDEEKKSAKYTELQNMSNNVDT